MIAYQNLVTTEFANKVIAISARLGIDPSWLMIVMYFESAQTFSPSIRNKNSGATGLIQLTKPRAVELGTTLDGLAKMTAINQLDYVERYLKPFAGKMTDLYNTYLAVFAPAFIGKPDASKVYVSGNDSYKFNKYLDTDKDGIISVAEIKATIRNSIPAGFSSGTIIAQDVKKPALIIAGVAALAYILIQKQ